MNRFIVAISCAALLWPATSFAQGITPAPAFEISSGYAGFVDESMIHHVTFGGALRWYLSPRFSVGPEVVYMNGPNGDSDVMATGNVTFDLLSPRVSRNWMPYVVGGGGLLRHRELTGTGSFASSEAAFAGGIGARAVVSDRWFVGAEWRVGSELHTRINGLVGVTLK
jgi:opacity protein-like surface antigen